jgi:hypothetical protein
MLQKFTFKRFSRSTPSRDEILLVFSTQLQVHQRMNANGTGTKWIIFLKQEYSKAWDFYNGDTLCTLCYSLYNVCDTHSVHNYLLKLWWSRLLCPRSSCYVFPPPLSGISWCSLTLRGGPGPPTPKVASPFPGSAHTPSPWFRTVRTVICFFAYLRLESQNLTCVVYTSAGAQLFKGEMPRPVCTIPASKGRKQQAYNTMTTSLC